MGRVGTNVTKYVCVCVCEGGVETKYVCVCVGGVGTSVPPGIAHCSRQRREVDSTLLSRQRREVDACHHMCLIMLAHAHTCAHSMIVNNSLLIQTARHTP